VNLSSKIVIKGIERTNVGTYLRWVDEKGLHHSTEHMLLLEYTKDGRYGLVQGDAEIINRVLECPGGLSAVKSVQDSLHNDPAHSGQLACPP
jgi:hypothetical protein